MNEFPFKKIDAFATAKSSGNPAGYIKLDSLEHISCEQMQRIASELKGFVNEVGYLCAKEEETFCLKYYSAEKEVEFCGHATIAILYDILKNTTGLCNKPEVTVITNKGSLIVENHIASGDAVFIMSPLAEFRDTCIPEQEIAAALNLHPDQIDRTHATCVVNAGLETLIVPVKTLDGILNLSPDFQTLKQFLICNNIDILEVFCKEVSCKQNDYRTRVFAPTFGYLEDPATGSGNSAFGYYLLRNGLWNGQRLSIEQNGSENYNLVQLKTRLDGENNRRVLFGGGAVTRIEGKYLLP